VAYVYWLSKTQQGYKERSLSVTLHWCNVGTACKPLFLLFPWWLFQISPNPNPPRWPRKDYLYMPIWILCIPTNVVRIVQCFSFFLMVHDVYFLRHDCEDHGGFHGWFYRLWQNLRSLIVEFRVLQRCEEKHLILNWEECHFLVQEGIVLGHKVSEHGIEVDKAKIKVIEKIPPPTNVKGIRSFLGHTGSHRRFIKNFS